MSTAVSGKTGSCKIGSTAILNLKSWKVDINQDLKEITNFNSNGWKEQSPTIKSWSGSAEGQWNVAGDTTGQAAIQNALLNSTSVSLSLNVNGTNAYSGTALIKKFSVSEPVDDIVTVSFDYEGTGALTYA